MEGEYRAVRTSKPKKMGRPKKDPEGNARRHQGKIFQPRFYREDAPMVMELIACKNLQELREKFGISLPDDINWYKSESAKVFALLEALARRGFEEFRERSIKLEEDFN